MTSSPAALGSTPRAITAGALADRLAGAVHGRADLLITGVNNLDEATDTDVTFLATREYARRWPDATAGAAVISKSLLDHVGEVPTNRALITVNDAEVSLIGVLEFFAPPLAAVPAGIHPMATVDPTAQVHPTASVAGHVSIGARCRIDAGAVLHPGVHLYEEVAIGKNTVIHAGTVIRERCSVGQSVLLHQNVSVGSDGFGFRPAPDRPGAMKMPHLGGVRIEDDVEIGSSTCIDRGKFGDTVIGMGSKIDNLVQIAHNCRIGHHAIIAGQVGIGGSVVMGEGVAIGGGAKVRDHVHIGDGAAIGGLSMILHDVPPGQRMTGIPAVEAGKALRQWAAVRKLPGLLRRLGPNPGTQRT